ncbi:MAG TPA: hypothetical protein VK217_09295 [Acidimicrobiales bacterium]|nr:hypothetical protein [Acidimicrobiales bacterium]
MSASASARWTPSFAAPTDDPATMTCVYCGAPATDRDHLSGRQASDNAQSDPDLWLPSCHRCNVLGYQAWEANGLTIVEDLAEARVRRVALSSLRVADSGLWILTPSRFWAALARLLVETGDELKKRASF